MKDQWLIRAALLLVSLLVVWNIYTGATVQVIGIPGIFTVQFGSSERGQPVSPTTTTASAPDQTTHESEISGAWRYEFRSEIAQVPVRGSLDLTVDGNVITGLMDNPDPERPGERSAVEGSFLKGTLVLRRYTNRQGVVQEYRLVPRADGFGGTFQNVGQIEGRFKDAGDFRIYR